MQLFYEKYKFTMEKQSKEQIIQQVNTFLVEKLEFEASAIHPEVELKAELGLTSIDVVQIALFLKQTYGIEPQMEDVKAIITLQDLYDYIEQHQTK